MILLYLKLIIFESFASAAATEGGAFEPKRIFVGSDIRQRHGTSLGSATTLEVTQRNKVGKGNLPKD